jgi:hypothetical protein
LPLFLLERRCFILPKIRLKVSMVGPEISHIPGDELEVREDVADAWIGAGIAELVEEVKPTKKAALKKDVVK